MKKKFLCKSKNGIGVFYDPEDSHTATHFKDAPGLRDVVVEYLSNKDLKGGLIAEDVDMGRTIGMSDVVPVAQSDEIVYAMRSKRKDQGYVPVTKSQTSKPCSLLSVYLIRQDPETYELSSAWIGEYDSPNFPQMDNATDDSEPYWRKHAFAWGSQEIIPGTERADCPW